MPPRVARSNVQAAVPKAGKNKNRKRNLDAFSIASHSAPEKKVKSSRLGEVLDDRPGPKRRRDDEDDEGSDGEEDAPPKRRRADPQDEDVEEGSDSSGNEWTAGGMREDDSDSELDSDEAFGESDEEKFEGFTFRGSRSRRGKKTAKVSSSRARVLEDEEGDINLDVPISEDEDEGEEDDFGDEGVDLATMLDDDDEETLGGKDTTGEDMSGESASEDDDMELNDADSESSDNEEGEEERIARMRDRIDALDASAQPAKTAARPSQPSALTMEDLLADLDPAQKKQFQSALKTKKKSERPKTLTAPLPKRQQDKLNREEASKKAKEQLDRWQDTVIRNRRAEFLQFPLKDPSAPERMGKDKFVMGDEQVPANELEQNIRQIMEESGLATKRGQQKEDEEDMLLKAEELATNKLPVEEVIQRRAELRRARELLFREEIKAKRIKKIKSKAYRRVHRKERQRQEQLEGELRGEEDLDEDEQEKFERKRAEARMSTKHKDSKFAKAMGQTNRSVWDDGAREAVIDEARRREELKRRIRGEEIGEDGAEGSDVPSGSDDGSEDGDEGAAISKSLDRLSRERDGGAAQLKGLNAMKFMQAADARQRAQNEEDVERMRKELAIEDGDEKESDDEIEDQELGRAIFGPKSENERKGAAKVKRPELEEGEASEDEDGADGEDEIIVTEKPEVKAKANSQKSAKAGNPLAKVFEANKPEKSQGNWLAAPAKKDEHRKKIQEHNLVMDISARNDDKEDHPTIEKPSKMKSQPPQADTQANNTDGWTLVQYNNNEEDSEAAEPTDPILTKSQENAALHNRLFAADEAIEATFAASKREAAESEDEKELSTHLPGWGSWTGAGLTRSEKRLNNHRKHHPLHKTKVAGVRQQDRKDAKLEDVIISERQNRKGKQYLADLLPHGFETKTQYERSLRLPMGPEWTTKATHQRATKPRVVVKPGVFVEGMERPLV